MGAASNPHLASFEPARSPHRLGALAALALHIAALAAILSYQPARSALLAAGPILVDWVGEPRIEPRKPAPKPRPGPEPVLAPKPRPAEPVPLIATANETPAPIAPPVPPPAPAATDEPAPPVTMPVFNADYLDNPPPVYPVLSRRLREQGRVLLRVLVSSDGRADEVQVRSSSGHERLDAAARDTVRGWKFVPAKRGAGPVPAWVLIPVSFRLEG